MSDQSHSAQVRAAKIIGIRPERIRMIETDATFRIDTEALAHSITEDKSAGYNPILVAANAGSSSTGSIDSLYDIANICENEGIWMHVDAAYGGFAVVTERGKKLLSGIERADSIVLDGHKWFFQPYETGCLMVKDVKTLEDAFTIKHDILQDTLWGANHPNFSDRGLQLSRSGRALKIWLSIQTFGMSAFRSAISRGVELAQQAEEYVRNSSILELILPVSLSIVCFRVNPKNETRGEEKVEKINRIVLARLFWEDSKFISSTMLHSKFSLRICILNHSTTWNDVFETLKAIENFGKEALNPYFS